jgi:23S rRNA (uracil1939-C5)-methyltransferase
MKSRLITVTPTSWSHRGSAVVFSEQGKPLDVWAGIVGEACRVAVTHRGQNRSNANFIKLAGEPHPFRRKDSERSFHISGSCPLMHMTQEGQHHAKLAMVRDSLQAAGFQDHAPTSMQVSSEGEWAYRHVVKLVYGRSERGSLRLGAYARGTNRIVTIADSEVVTPVLRDCMNGVAYRLIQADIWPYDPNSKKGLLRYVVMRQSRSTGQVLVTLVGARKDSRLREIADEIQSDIASVVGVLLHINDQPGNAIYARDEEGEIRTRKLVGKPYIEDTICSNSLGIGGGDFFQVNPAVAELICKDVLDEFAEHPDLPVLDLYCGVGAFTMALARQHGWALGVEVIQGAIRQAKESALRNRVSAEFIAGSVGDVLPSALARVSGKAPLMVLNPSRKGLEPEVGRSVLAAKPMRLAYISCNPRALSRDLTEICERGWKVDSIRAYDMLPQTAHVELLAMLSPIEAPSRTGRAPRRRIAGR